ncbi:hypothetical protein [Rhodococcus tibetensis]|uniref:Secreted protein n=1 Tax=Rhodococcus tibetensis TaxID=2965064 RepID=A0ABT1QCS6_9NOCA|nr:hypothetical protein [Rhodococcus sp. FXJ9.536]MCQ4120050.1 hypothetical protein [Rhodococcus sp. FXJ9.536]
MQKKSVRRTAALAGLMAAPLVLGSTVGVGTAGADPWHVGPVYRAETSGEGAEYFCNKAAALEQTTGYIIIPCTLDTATDVWYRVVVNPVNWAFEI